jgi:3-deoxy-D-manno-octulosonate 8-phosphate phosphatase (KDO 8-P phosphatase)
LTDELKDRIRKVRLVIVDNDGVMTDGRIVYGDHGDELKFFDVHDGHGLVMLRRAGFDTVMISGRVSRINPRRMKETQFSMLYQKAIDKLSVFEKVLKKFKIGPSEVCAVGDDVIDLPILTRCGFAVAVANATPEVKKAAHYVTEKSGGRGAVREVTDLLLKTQGKWEEAMARYLR